jgi:hypothetical protein
MLGIIKLLHRSYQKTAACRRVLGIVIPTFKQMKNPETLPEKIKKN